MTLRALKLQKTRLKMTFLLRKYDKKRGELTNYLITAEFKPVAKMQEQTIQTYTFSRLENWVNVLQLSLVSWADPC